VVVPFNDNAIDSSFSSSLSVSGSDASAAAANCAAGAHSGTTSVFSHHFTISSVNCKGVDSDGTFNGQITFTGNWPMAWGYTINQANPYAAAATSSVKEAADYYNTSTKKRITSYHDSHPSEPIDYHFHSATPVNDGGVGYQLDILFTWKFRTAHTSGTAQLYVTFNYTAYGPDGCGCTGTTSPDSVSPDC
jgi:hypothetical protein